MHSYAVKDYNNSRETRGINIWRAGRVPHSFMKDFIQPNLDHIYGWQRFH